MKLIVCIGKDTKHKDRRYDIKNLKKSQAGCVFFEAHFNWLCRQQEGTEMPTGEIYKLDTCKVEYYFALLNGLTHVFVFLKCKYEENGKMLAKLIKEIHNQNSKFWTQVDISRIPMHTNRTQNGMNFGEIRMGITEEDWNIWKEEGKEFDPKNEMLLMFNTGELPVSVIQFVADPNINNKEEVKSIVAELKLEQIIGLLIGTMDGQDSDDLNEHAILLLDQSMRNARQAVLLTSQKPFEEAANIVNTAEIESFKKRYSN